MMFLNLCWLIYEDQYRPDFQQTTDFLCIFYPAGYAIGHGRYGELYPAKDATTYRDCPFDKLSHSLLPLLPKESVTVWQYTPWTAVAITPFSFLPPLPALICWQAVTIMALYASCFFLAETVGSITPTRLFVLSFIFLPVFHMLKLGQCGILMGLLPIVMGLYCLRCSRFSLAGLAFSLSLFSLKYLPVVLLISTLLLLQKNRQTLIALLLGCTLQIGTCLVILPGWLWSVWADSLHIAERYYLLDPDISHRWYYYVSLTSVLLSMIPLDMRENAKYLTYALSAAIALHALYFCTGIMRSALSKEIKLAAITVISLFLMPLVEPHLIFYDTVPLFIVVVLFWQDYWPGEIRMRLQAVAVTLVLLLDVDLIVFAFVNTELIHPILIILGIAGLYIQFLVCCNRLMKIQSLDQQLSD